MLSLAWRRLLKMKRPIGEHRLRGGLLGGREISITNVGPLYRVPMIDHNFHGHVAVVFGSAPLREVVMAGEDEVHGSNAHRKMVAKVLVREYILSDPSKSSSPMPTRLRGWK